MERKEFAMRINIVTRMDWPSFANVAVQIRKALNNYCSCTIYDQTNVKPGGNILFIGTLLHQTLNFLSKFLGQSNIVFYGTTEGHSFVNEASLRIAKQIKIIAVSNFVKQMFEEIGIPVAGVVHHGLDMNDRKINTQYYKTLEKKLKDNKVILTVSANHSRKGLERLLQAYQLVEKEIEDSFLILHSERVGYYSTAKIAANLQIKRIWLTNLFGKLSQSRLNALYKLCSVYVQPSYSEGFGLPILEAFRFDKPVIAVDAPPFNEVIRQRENGILMPLSKISWFKFENLILFKMHMYRTEDLARAILELMSNQQQTARMRENIQKEKQNWNMHKLYPELLNYFM